MSQANVQRAAEIVNRLRLDDFETFLTLIRPVTAKECAAALGVSVKTLNRRLDEDPDFPSLHFGKRRVFNLCAVFRYLRTNGKPSNSEQQ